MNLLETNLFNKKIKNPFIIASGPCGNFEELSEIIDINNLGGITTKTITKEPKIGNKAPRIVNLNDGLLNSIGLENKGIDYFIENEIKRIENYNTLKIISIGGYNEYDFEYMIEKIDDYDIDFYELNLSCPNVNKGGATLLNDKKLLSKVIERSCNSTDKPIFLKFGYESNLEELVKIGVYNGASGVTLINTLKGMKIDINTGKPILKMKTGGVSGSFIKPMAVHCIYKIREKFPYLPIIGMGGVFNHEDAIELAMAGANLIGVGTAMMMDPEIVNKIIKNTAFYLSSKNKNFEDIVSKSHERTDNYVL
ncbi:MULTISPECIES: dihydroorotate dehydrogenase [Oceanotoga]|jgi:dihydroorotate dehydrogenase (NAD+) catalytic subunit|uniref:dihydroorotate dehydrogenase n=1 Tax=Oceanotoga TaxID=1255275 RepID=UPI002656B00C|nr:MULTISPECIES: dihydroorotate dehydrogenase [Oceanotoga]MDN5342641.1 dihydroorotate dehydrogenase catalytic subunit [Oceanotoga sp.]MDO7975964.1 dihydroorotate dehydrogenase [Oceanotoga teriensis]